MTKVQNVLLPSPDFSLFTGSKNTEGLLGTAKHVVDKGTIQIFAAWTNEVKKGFMIRHKVSFIHQFFFMNKIETCRTQHHKAARDRYRFSPVAT